jgi:hypothetical protein
MTFVLAWKFRSSIYLVADTAVTADYPVVDRTYTSFEERSISQPGKSVYEGALKLINLERAAIAVAGNSALGQSIASTFKDTLRVTGNPREALRTTVMSNGPFNSKRSCQLVVAFPSSPTPTLLSFNFNDNHDIIEEREGCCLAIGSIPEIYKNLSFQLLDLFAPGFYNKPSWFLMMALASVQSYGIHDYMNIFEKGVGGAFCGLFIGEHSIEWQSDILFLLYDRGRDSNINAVESIVRDHVLVVRSLDNNNTRYFLNAISCDSIEDWYRKWFIPAHTFISYGRFDFVVLLSRRFRIITIIEMFKHQSNQFLSITRLPSDASFEQVVPDPTFLPPYEIQLELGFTEQLCEIMDEPTPDSYDGSTPFAAFNWYPYCRHCREWTPFVVQSGVPATCSICRIPL